MIKVPVAQKAGDEEARWAGTGLWKNSGPYHENMNAKDFRRPTY
jgi:hypothetical protein